MFTQTVLNIYDGGNNVGIIAFYLGQLALLNVGDRLSDSIIQHCPYTTSLISLTPNCERLFLRIENNIVTEIRNNVGVCGVDASEPFAIRVNDIDIINDTYPL